MTQSASLKPWRPHKYPMLAPLVLGKKRHNFNQPQTNAQCRGKAAWCRGTSYHQSVTRHFPKDPKVDPFTLLLGTGYLGYLMQLPHPKGRTYTFEMVARHQTHSWDGCKEVKVGPLTRRFLSYLQSQVTKWNAHEMCFAGWHFPIEMNSVFWAQRIAWKLAAIRIAHWQMQIWYIWNIGHWKNRGTSNSNAQSKRWANGSIRIKCSKKVNSWVQFSACKRQTSR